MSEAWPRRGTEAAGLPWWTIVVKRAGIIRSVVRVTRLVALVVTGWDLAPIMDVRRTITAMMAMGLVSLNVDRGLVAIKS
jgi:hypothetical protein